MTGIGYHLLDCKSGIMDGMLPISLPFALQDMIIILEKFRMEAWF